MSTFIPLEHCTDNVSCLASGECLHDCVARGPRTTKYRIDGKNVEEEEAKEKIAAALDELESDEERRKVLLNVRQQIADQEKSILKLSTYCQLIACGTPIDGDTNDRKHFNDQILKVFSRANIDPPKTPSERLRVMLKHGKQALADILERPLSYAAFVASVQRMVENGEPTEIGKIGSLGKEMFDVYSRRLYSCALWASEGANQFVMSQALASALMLTDVPEVTAEEMHLPYRVFAISIPSGVVPFFAPTVGGSDQEWADTLWLEQSGDQLLWVVRWRTLEVHRYSTSDFAWKAHERIEDENAVAPEDEISLDASMRLVRNFLLWLDCQGGPKAQQPVSVPAKLAEKRKRSGEEWPRQWELGKDVVLSPELRRSAAEIALGRSARHAVEGWKVRARFTVRGHWRNQAHGPARALRMRKWIAPFWKGPAEKEAWAHIYRDEKPALPHRTGG